mmetsp:Transcript_87381/g.248012  ORF Transcript_87381/g.248012 Transcript_87381/m.248012 type:complete len:301 (-) Transcript_87381:835-1737(-)
MRHHSVLGCVLQLLLLEYVGGIVSDRAHRESSPGCRMAFQLDNEPLNPRSSMRTREGLLALFQNRTAADLGEFPPPRPLRVPPQRGANINGTVVHPVVVRKAGSKTVQAIDNALTQYLGCSARKLQNGTWVGNSPGCIVRRIVYKRKAVGNRVKNKQNPELRPRPSEEPMDTPADRGRPQFRVEQVMAWAFVRHPYTRLVAGYQEIVHRHIDCCDWCAGHTKADLGEKNTDWLCSQDFVTMPPTDEPARFNSFIGSVLSTDLPWDRVAFDGLTYHVFSQMTAIAEFSECFVGHLERYVAR